MSFAVIIGQLPPRTPWEASCRLSGDGRAKGTGMDEMGLEQQSEERQMQIRELRRLYNKKNV